MSLETTNNSEKFDSKRISLSVFLLALASEMSFIKMHSVESRRVIGPENVLCVCRRVCASFSPEIVQAGAVKWLIMPDSQRRGSSAVFYLSCVRVLLLSL